METTFLNIVFFQFCFFLVYELLLRKETFFNWNRMYLIASSILSIVLPFIKLELFSRVIPEEYIIKLPTIIIGENQKKILGAEHFTASPLIGEFSFSLNSIWYVGMVFFTIILLYKFYKLVKLTQNNSFIKKKGYTIATLKNSEDAFSFFNTIFIGDQLKKEHVESILKHERVHVNEKHTIDLLWFELLRIVFWFNPLVYLYQNRITEIHEFIADKYASKYQQNYYQSLLSHAFNVAKFSIVNQFYSSSLIKKRIIMLTKEKSNSTLKIKYVIALPLIMAMLIIASCGETYDKADKDLIEQKAASIELKEAPDYTEQTEVSFKILDEAPIFPGCEDKETLEELKKCFTQSISAHVVQNFNTKLAKELNLTGKQRILVAFKVNTQGHVEDVKVTAAHEKLIKEAERVISTLPQLTPARHQGKNVTVPYSLPIIFAVN